MLLYLDKSSYHSFYSQNNNNNNSESCTKHPDYPVREGFQKIPSTSLPKMKISHLDSGTVWDSAC